jgi:ADP-ribosylglycohydrolase
VRIAGYRLPIVLSMIGVAAGDASAGDGRAGELSQLTLATAESLIRTRIRASNGKQPNDLDQLRRSYLRWASLQGVKVAPSMSDQSTPLGWLGRQDFMSELRPQGNTTRAAIESWPPDQSRAVNDSSGAACVPRAAPLGVVKPFGSGNGLDIVFKLAADSASLTHGSPIAQAATGTYAVILNFLLDGNDLGTAADLSLEWLGTSQDKFDQETVAAVTGPMQDALNRSSGGGEYHEAELFGWKGHTAAEALAIGVWAARSEQLGEVLERAAVKGGEQHATQAIAGGLWGASAGAQIAASQKSATESKHTYFESVPQLVDVVPEALLPPPEQLLTVSWVAEDLFRVCVLGQAPTNADQERYPGL